MSMGMDTVKRKLEKKKTFPFRQPFTEQHEKFRILTGYRDAHFYFFPYWVKDLVRRDERLGSVKGDLIGSWAKSQWQRGLGKKIGNRCLSEPTGYKSRDRLQDVSTTVHAISQNDLRDSEVQQPVETTPLLAYLQTESAPLIRRVHSPALLLSTSLRLAKMGSIGDVIHTATLSPFAHDQKIAYSESISKRCHISKANCLLAPKVIVEKGCVIKETCIGPNSKICNGARLTRCVILDNVAISERCVLTGCIVESRSLVGKNSVLEDSEVREGYTVGEQTEAKGEILMPLFKDISGKS